MTADTLSGDATLVLPEFDGPPTDPIALFARWLDDAGARSVREPLAATLATTDGRLVSSRTILVKGVVDGRIVFGSRTTSRKGQDLRDVPHASLTFYWRETLQQVHLSGPVTELDGPTSDALFGGRTRDAQAVAVSAQQSDTLDDENALRRAVGALVGSDDPIARPADWAGYALAPDRIEFWHGRSDRMHRRLEYVAAPGGWTARRLQP